MQFLDDEKFEIFLKKNSTVSIYIKSTKKYRANIPSDFFWLHYAPYYPFLAIQKYFV